MTIRFDGMEFEFPHVSYTPGASTADGITMEWQAHYDERVRPIHAALIGPGSPGPEESTEFWHDCNPFAYDAGHRDEDCDACQYEIKRQRAEDFSRATAGDRKAFYAELQKR